MRLAFFSRMIAMTRRRWIVAAVALVALVGLASVIALFFIDEPLRRYTEAKMNARLKGYTATIGALHFSPINFSLELKDTVIVQNEHPDPPVANIGRLYASVHWQALLSGRVVGDILIDRPVVVLDLPRRSRRSTTPPRSRTRDGKTRSRRSIRSRSTSFGSRAATSPTRTMGPSSPCACRIWRSRPPISATCTPRKGCIPRRCASDRARVRGRLGERHRLGRLPRRAPRRVHDRRQARRHRARLLQAHHRSLQRGDGPGHCSPPRARSRSRPNSSR